MTVRRHRPWPAPLTRPGRPRPAPAGYRAGLIEQIARDMETIRRAKAFNIDDTSFYVERIRRYRAAYRRAAQDA